MPLAVRTSLGVLWLVLLLQSASPASGVRTTVTDSLILVENDLLVRSFPVSHEAGSRIAIGGLVEKRSGANLFIRDGQTPWFECSVNGAILTNLQPVWTFTGHQRRAMRHGGEEICLNYLVDRGAAAGLRVTHRLQMYPGSGVLRERLEFRGTEGCDLRMTKERGRGHLIFPSYIFHPASRLTMREIQLADWGGVAIERQPATESYDERGRKQAPGLDAIWPPTICITRGAGIGRPFHRSPEITKGRCLSAWIPSVHSDSLLPTSTDHPMVTPNRTT